MIFREIRERLTGISCPIFGVSWNPSETERTKAIKIIRFLEDRRVLYNPYEQECPDHCIHSIIKFSFAPSSSTLDIPTFASTSPSAERLRKVITAFAVLTVTEVLSGWYSVPEYNL